MTPLFLSRRAAEELDALLAGTASPATAERHADLLVTVGGLRSVAPVTPRAEFSADLRARLMLAAETELVPAPPVLRRATTSSRAGQRVGTVAAALVIVGGTAGMAAAASGALPGEALYPIKRGGEQVGEIVRVTEAGKGRALLSQADTRLSEVRDLMADDASDVLVEDTLGAFRSAADGGAQKLFASYRGQGDAADVTTVRAFAARQMTTLQQMAAAADPTQAGMLLDAADTLADLDQQARMLCGGCGPDAELLTPTALSEGAAAASMSNLLARPTQQVQTDLDAARAAALAGRTQKAADATPTITLPTSPTTPGSGTTTSEPVTRAVSGSGQLSAGVKAGTKAVDGLVEGVTSTVDATTGGAVSGLTGAVTSTTKGLADTVDGTVGGLLP